MGDAWYRRAWFIGPQAVGLLAVLLLASVNASPSHAPANAGWVHPNNDKGRFEAAKTLALQAKTDPAAEALLRQKAIAGEAMAQFFLGYLADPTIDRAAATAERTRTSEDWYRKAAEQNLAIAQANLGTLVAYERFGMPPDYPEAYRWLDNAAPHVPSAQRELGVLYRLGRGVPAAQRRGMELIRSAADRGDAISQTMLADALDHGSDGLLVDHGEAARLLQKAAMANNPVAQRLLGIHLRDGDGVAADLKQSRYWFTRAAANGDNYAKTQIDGVPAPKGAPGSITPFSFAPIGK